MNAGLPGTGLGGVFYIASAIVMPFHRATRGGGHCGRTWRRVLLQGGMGLGILASLFATGWVIGLLIMPDPAALGVGRPGVLSPAINVLRWVALVGTLGLLALLLLAVEVAGFVLRRTRRTERVGARARHARIRAIRRRRRTAPAPAAELERVA